MSDSAAVGAPPQNTGPKDAATSVKDRLKAAVLTPVLAMKPRYAPLLMVYFAYGALGLIGVARTFWVRESLSFSPAQLAELGVWLTLPWTIKMVFGQLVDSVPLLGSNRRAYVVVGAGLLASGLALLAGAAGGWITFASPDTLFVAAMLLVTIGIVLQDVVADAMSAEVVPREQPDGTPRPEDDVRRELALVQVLGRLALTFGIVATAGLSGWLASVFSYETVFLLGLAIPAISVAGALLVKLERTEPGPIDWPILGGGLAFGLAVAGLGLSGAPFGQEIVFVGSLAVISFLLTRVVEDLSSETKWKIFFSALIIFVFRANPTVGEGYTWFRMDVLGFDEAFFGVLAQIGAVVSLVTLWLLSDAITRMPIIRVLILLTILGAALSLPDLGLVYGLHEWTEATFGFGAHSIALIDAAAESPLVHLSMIPILTLVAIYAPPARRATWFALMASLMNLALVAGQLQTKYLNQLFPIERGAYDALPILVPLVIVIGVAAPLAVALLFGRRAT